MKCLATERCRDVCMYVTGGDSRVEILAGGSFPDEVEHGVYKAQVSEAKKTLTHSGNRE